MGLSSFLTYFRQKLFKVYRKLSSKSTPPGTTYHRASRFIFSGRHFSGSRVKPEAFTPPKSFKLSCFWIDDLAEDVIWRIGDDIAGRPRGKQALASADLARNDIFEVGLFTEDDPNPHPRHMNVCGWPTDKDEIKSLVLDLCSRAILRIR
jgi:hypothetical protein